MGRETVGYVYILTNTRKTVLYIGVTSNLLDRITQHKQKITKGFTARYNVDRLVYYEIINDMQCAIEREKQLKNYSRKKKEQLIAEKNPEWKDLYVSLYK